MRWAGRRAVRFPDPSHKHKKEKVHGKESEEGCKKDPQENDEVVRPVQKIRLQALRSLSKRLFLLT